MYRIESPEINSHVDGQTHNEKRAISSINDVGKTA
jgi:hypothetical protein